MTKIIKTALFAALFLAIFAPAATYAQQVDATLTGEQLQAAIDQSQEHVEGTVRMKLYKGSAEVVGRWSDKSLYSEAHVTFEDDAGAYDQADAQGFIKLNALRLRLLAARDRK